MNDIAQTWFQMVDVIIDERMKENQYDKTTFAEIYSIENPDIGKYKIKYNGNIIEATDLVNKTLYSVGDSVIIRIAQNDLTKGVYIEGLTNNGSMLADEIIRLNNEIKTVGPNWASETEASIIAGGDISSVRVCGQTDPSLLETFRSYAQQCSKVRISASFRTNFIRIPAQGNYGLLITFDTVDGGTVDYYFDCAQFVGNFYEFYVETPQVSLIEVQTEFLSGIHEIRLFQENFGDESFLESLEADRAIYLTDLQVQFATEQELINDTYYLNINALDGVIFTERGQALRLEPQLVYNQTSLLRADNYTAQ